MEGDAGFKSSTRCICLKALTLITCISLQTSTNFINTTPVYKHAPGKHSTSAAIVLFFRGCYHHDGRKQEEKVIMRKCIEVLCFKQLVDQEKKLKGLPL